MDGWLGNVDRAEPARRASEVGQQVVVEVVALLALLGEVSCVVDALFARGAWHRLVRLSLLDQKHRRHWLEVAPVLGHDLRCLWDRRAGRVAAGTWNGLVRDRLELSKALLIRGLDDVAALARVEGQVAHLGRAERRLWHRREGSVTLRNDPRAVDVPHVDDRVVVVAAIRLRLLAKQVMLQVPIA